MKKSSKIVLALLIIAAVLFGVYRMMNTAPSTQLDSNAQMVEIIENNGCLECHTANPQLPFYANFPVAGKLVKEDIRLAYRSFDMTPMTEALKTGAKGNEVDLAK